MRNVSIVGTAVVILVTGMIVLGMADTHNFFQLSIPEVQQDDIRNIINPYRQHVSEDSTFIFLFEEDVDKASIVDHLIIPEGLTGSITWYNNSVMLLHGAEAWERRRTYTFSFQSGARYQTGAPLPKDISYTFVISGTPTIISSIPTADATKVPTDTVISIVFDRPMVPISYVHDEDTQPHDIEISPPIAGTWRWAGTSTLVLEPEEPLRNATQYTVTLPKNVAKNRMLEDAYTFTFSTDPLRVRGAREKPIGDERELRRMIEVRFSADVDLETLQPLILLNALAVDKQKHVAIPGEATPDWAYTEGRSLPFAATYKPIEDEDGAVQEYDKSSVLLTITQPLDLHSRYRLRIEKGNYALTGNMQTAEVFKKDFVMPGHFSVKEIDPADYSMRITFSNKYDFASLEQYLSIVPEPSNWNTRNILSSTGSDTAIYTVHVDFDPETTYTVTVHEGVRDIYGQYLPTPVTHTFTTEALEPRLFVHDAQEFGVFERSKPPIFYVNGVNLDDGATVQLAKVSPQKFIELYNQSSHRNEKNYNMWNTLSSLPGGKTHTLDFGAKSRNTWHVIPVDVRDVLSLAEEQSGLFAMSTSSPNHSIRYWWTESSNNTPNVKPEVHQQLFAMTNIALTLKYTGDSALIWAQDMTTGQPVSNARIDLLNDAGTIVRYAHTNKEGLAQVTLPLKQFQMFGEGEPAFWVLARKGSDVSILHSNWSNGISAYNFGYSQDFHGLNRAPFSMHMHIQTDRPLYRAGHTVQFKGTVRLNDKNNTLSIPEGRTVDVHVRDAEDREVLHESYALDEYGTFSGSIPIDEEASLGTYWIEAVLASENDDLLYAEHWKSFDVLAYRRAEFDASLTTTQSEYVDGDMIEGTIEGSYFFGSPLAGAAVEWRAYETEYRFHKYTDGWYRFSDTDDWCYWDCEQETDLITEGKGYIGEDGTMMYAFPYALDGKNGSQIVSVEASITDESDRTIHTSTSVPVHAAEIYVGIQAQQYSYEPGEDAKVNIVTVNTDGSVAPNEDVDVTLISRDWNSVRKKDVDGKYYWHNEHTDTIIDSTSVRTNDAGKAVAAINVPRGGSFRMIATVRDDALRSHTAGTDIYAYSDGYVHWPRTNTDRLEVIQDKPEYAPGDTAKLLVKSPYQGTGVHALVTIEREEIVEHFVTRIEGTALPIEIEITEDMIPNVYASVIIMKPRQGETFNEHGLDTGLPTFKMGLTKLSVDHAAKKLDVDIRTDKERYLPGEKVTFFIETKDSAGKGQPSDVSLSVVDMSVLALTGFQKPDLVELFYAQRPLFVRTAQMLMFMLERFRPGSKGGGGGDGAETAVRGTFKDTAYWNPSIRTNEEGKAVVHFTLPDNLTTWKALAVAQTTNHTFGSADTEFIETKNVIVRPNLPRFAVQGDTITIKTIVHNESETAQEFTVRMDGDGFDMSEETAATQTVYIGSGSQQPVFFTVHIANVQQSRFRVSAKAHSMQDVVEQTLPVYTVSVPQSFATFGVASPLAQEEVYLPPEEKTEDLHVTAMISASVAHYLPVSLQHLIDFRYRCAEQTMSKIFPTVVLQSLEEYDIVQSTGADIAQMITQNIEYLYTLQKHDGGFGYWINSANSSPTLTAYVTHGLHVAQQRGVAVEQQVVDRAAQYLKEKLRDRYDDEQPWLMSKPLRAHILFVLAELGYVDRQQAIALYEEREALPLYALSYLGMALHTLSPDQSSEYAQTIANELRNAVHIDDRTAAFSEKNANNYRWSMNTNDRTNALALQALIRIQPEHPLIPKIMRSLLYRREDGKWDTTQSTAHALLTLKEYLDRYEDPAAKHEIALAVNEAIVYEATLQGSQKKIVDVPLGEHLTHGQLNGISLSTSAEQPLYYDIVSSYRWVDTDIQSVDRGMTIMREMYTLDGEKVTPQTYRVGDVYKVQVTVSTPSDRHFVAVESPLPSGFEPVNASFKTNENRELREANKEEDRYWYDRYYGFEHSELHDDRVFLFAERLNAGSYTHEYLVRVTHAGLFAERPAHAWEMYYPETFGHTHSSTVEVHHE